MSRLFDSISIRRPKKNVFDLSHERKFSMSMGDLVPIFCEDVVPGDTFKMNSEILMRLAPMVAPVMHRVNVYTHFFFVPNRLIWDEWEDFITGGKDGLQVPVMPYIDLENDDFDGNFTQGRLSDYLGYPTIDDPKVGKFGSLPFRAYSLIYNEFYRDQNLIDEVPISKLSGEEREPRITDIRKRCWEKDYFTSALPWTQKGGEVNLPFDAQYNPTYKQASVVREYSGGPSNSISLSINSGELQDDTYTALRIENLEDEQTISSSIVTINDLRLATRLQAWLEKNARGGSRYIEQIFAHFGVVSSDARLQRPEFLGGGRSPVVISEVLQTSESNESAQGTMAGHGISVGNSHSFKKSFEEHGILMGIISVLPRTAYQDGLRRQFHKFDKFDFFFPEFANLGEQPVYNRELYVTKSSDSDIDDSVFGYQSRYAEYKYIPSTVHGDFRGNLNYWHMGRIFSSAPSLNKSFVEANPTERIFAVTDGSNKLYVQMYNQVTAIRPMPKFGTPIL